MTQPRRIGFRIGPIVITRRSTLEEALFRVEDAHDVCIAHLDITLNAQGALRDLYGAKRILRTLTGKSRRAPRKEAP